MNPLIHKPQLHQSTPLVHQNLRYQTFSTKATNRTNVRERETNRTYDKPIERMYENESYVTIKYYKEHFQNKICRLINSSKSDIGKISKTMLDKIITSFINQCKSVENSTSVIEWYKTIPNKDQYRFIIFDIENCL